MEAYLPMLQHTMGMFIFLDRNYQSSLFLSVLE